MLATGGRLCIRILTILSRVATPFCLGKPTATSHWPLTPILLLAPFEKWGIDFIGPIAPAAKTTRNRYIILASDYATKWVEAKATKKNDAMVASTLLFENIITHFWCPLELVSDRGLYFLNDTIQHLTRTYRIKHRKTTPYNPKANGLTENANGLIERILVKVVSAHKSDWDQKLPSALWAYCTAEKIITKHTPFYLVYGLHSVMLVKFDFPTAWVQLPERQSLLDSQTLRLEQFDRLEEDWHHALMETEGQQDWRATRYNSKLKPVIIKVGDLVLMYDNRYFHFLGKLHTRWLRPYVVKAIFPNGSLLLADLDRLDHPTRVNGSRVKKYYLPQLDSLQSRNQVWGEGRYLKAVCENKNQRKNCKALVLWGIEEFCFVKAASRLSGK